jgi:hypothetical protein
MTYVRRLDEEDTGLPFLGAVRDPRPAPLLRGRPGSVTGSELGWSAARRVTVHASPPRRGRLAASRILTVRREVAQKRVPRREFHLMAKLGSRAQPSSAALWRR